MPRRRSFVSKTCFKTLVAAALGLAAAALSGCIYLPSHTEGLPSGGAYVALPLSGWIAERGVKAEGIAGCFAAECAPRVAVGIFHATARRRARSRPCCASPSGWCASSPRAMLPTRAPQRKGVRTVATVEKLREGSAAGFAATLAREDGTRAAHAVVLGAEGRDGLRIAIVIGESREGVRMTAREVAAKLK